MAGGGGVTRELADMASRANWTRRAISLLAMTAHLPERRTVRCIEMPARSDLSLQPSTICL